MAVVLVSAGGCHDVHQCPILQGITGWRIPAPLPPEGRTYTVVGKREGIRFFIIKYTNNLYRAGDIRSAKGAEALKQLGIKTIIATTTSNKQRTMAKDYGLKLVEIPFGWSDMSGGDLREFLRAVDAGPEPVCVISRTGTLRAGILLAHYRVHRQGWTVDEALNEYYRLEANYFDAVTLVKVLKENAPDKNVKESKSAL